MPIIKCETCGKEKNVFPSKIKEGQKNYCSRKCYEKQIAQRQTGEKNHNWNENLISKEELKDLYLNKKLGMDRIGKLKGCSWKAIKLRITKWGIKQRTANEQVSLGIHQNIEKFGKATKGKNNPAYTNGKMVGQKANRREYLKVAKENYEWICMTCGKNNTKFDLVVHHIDNNNKNNKVENLKILCQSCHAKLHAKTNKCLKKLGKYEKKNGNN